MDLVSPITKIVSRVIDCSAKHLNYLRKLDENLNQLKEKMEQLKALNIDVDNKVIVGEARLMKRTNQVDEWMQRVEAKRPEVEQVILEGTQNLERWCLNGCCPRNCCSSYKLGKNIAKKLILVEELKRDGAFEIFVENPPLAITQEQPETTPVVGLDSVVETAWNFLGENSVRIMGLYGMGGVGKTTLLKRINNELRKRGCDFDIVIWVVISKEENMARVQEEIGNKLGLPLPNATNILEVLQSKRFLLLLDDIWKRIDLLSIGVPSPSSENKSKIVFTTRSVTVCGAMDADKIIRVECLSWGASWALFQEKVGDRALRFDADVPRLAEIVAKECLGLPLALITIGRSMASKNTCQEWEHAISTLKNCAAEFPGMGDDVLPLLKYSYDSLPNDNVRLCFLFCSLYPEDYSIRVQKLIEQSIGEGYISGYDNCNNAFNSGYDIIGILKNTCLLEEGEDGSVKMHEVIRDLALWIACECGREKDKYFVKAGVRLTEAPQAGKWPTMAEKISLFGNDITQLENIPQCPNLTTLLVSENRTLKHIPHDFFLSMRALRFLDLSNTAIKKVPSSICELFELEFLDLSSTKFEILPSEIRNLTKVKYLSLRDTIPCIIPRGIIKNLSNLEFLMGDVIKFGHPEGWFGIDELGYLNNLKFLEINIYDDRKDVEKFLSYPKLANCARKLSIISCIDITSLSQSASSSSSSELSLKHLKVLQYLRIETCLEIKDLNLNKRTIEFGGLYDSLEGMELIYLPNLVISWDARNLQFAQFRKLHRVKLCRCDAMVDLTWLLFVPKLQTLWIETCDSLQEIITSSGESGVAYDENTFSYLKTLRLYNLPNLQSICSISALCFPSLGSIHVRRCPKLRALPVDSNSAKNTLKMIEGEMDWWNGLQWKNEAVKTQFTKFCTRII